MLKTKMEKIITDCLERCNFQTVENKMYDYYKILSRAGKLNLFFTLNKTKGQNTVSIFMAFDEPEKARIAGFDCNDYSGKFNFHILRTEREIDYVFGLLDKN